jgi:integrase
MVQLQLEAGMRPGEVIIMRVMDLDTSGKVWLYRPGSDQEHGAHKTAWRGQDRVISLGPRAQKVLRPWLDENVADPTAYLFQPKEARERQDADRRRERMTPMTPSQAKRRRKRKPKRQPGNLYTVTSYARAVARGCELAFPFPEGLAEDRRPKWTADHQEEIDRWRKEHHWHPSQLRHTRATEIRRQADLDTARAVLGHRSPAVTETYAEIDLTKAAELMERIG